MAPPAPVTNAVVNPALDATADVLGLVAENAPATADDASYVATLVDWARH